MCAAQKVERTHALVVVAVVKEEVGQPLGAVDAECVVVAVALLVVSKHGLHAPVLRRRGACCEYRCHKEHDGKSSVTEGVDSLSHNGITQGVILLPSAKIAILPENGIGHGQK